MKIKLAVLVTLLALGGSLFGQAQNFPGGVGGITSVATVPATCTAGVTVVQLSTGPLTGHIFSCPVTNLLVDITTVPPPVTSGLIANYPFLDGTGTVLTDISGNGNNGTLASGNSLPSWQVAIASDNCLSTALSPNWSQTSGTFIEASNTCRINSVGTNNLGVALYNAITFPPDQWARLTIGSAQGTGAAGPVVRASGSVVNSQNGYGCFNNNTTAFLFKNVNAVVTTLQSTARTPATGDIIYLQVVGATQTCTLTTTGGVVTTLTGSDAVLTSGQPGMYGITAFGVGGGGSPALTNWQAGSAAIPAAGGLWFYGGQFVTLPTIFNSTAKTMQFYSCYQRNSNANLYNALVQGNGNGANSNANGLIITGQVGSPGNGPVLQQVPHLSVLSGSAFGMTPYSNFNGCGVATVTFGTAAAGTVDATFINGTESVYVSTGTGDVHTTGGTLQTVGAYQLGGAAAGSGFGTASFLTGAIYYGLVYNRVLLPLEIQQNANFLQASMSARGVNSFLGDTARGDTCVTDGDSITNGFGLVTGQVWTQNLSFFTPANGTAFNSGGTSCWNQGVSATTMKKLDQTGAINIDPLYNVAARNVDIIWACTNDMITPLQAGTAYPGYSATGGQCLQSMQHYAQQRRAAGWKVIVVDMISRQVPTNAGNCTNGDVNKDAFNPLLRQYWNTFADGFTDLASSTAFADATCLTNTFQADGIHPSAHGQMNIISPLIERSVNRIYGNNSFSEATTYVAPALAATATTAGSEATNTVTITFGATPANCQIGNILTIAGTTPAGYGGNFLILTRSATQVTYFNPTTGLGAISVQGTGVCPQLQDQDRYSIVNFGAGNFTLDTCVGYTGQNLYIRNINGVATTLVPFASETITGPGTTTLAAATTAILQSTLVANGAGGCNWVRLQ
jgi:lysophospholipase L1-like esterase